jgi:hypothetical protein
MFHPLPGRIRLLAQRRANSGQFVSGDTGSHSTAAYQEAPFSIPLDEGLSHGFGKIRVIHRVTVVSAKIQHLVPRRL